MLLCTLTGRQLEPIKKTSAHEPRANYPNIFWLTRWLLDLRVNQSLDTQAATVFNRGEKKGGGGELQSITVLKPSRVNKIKLVRYFTTTWGILLPGAASTA